MVHIWVMDAVLCISEGYLLVVCVHDKALYRVYITIGLIITYIIVEFQVL